MTAALHGRTGCVRALLAAGAAPGAATKNGETALMRAARYGRTTAAEALLGAGADPRRRATAGWWEGKSALDLASLGGDTSETSPTCTLLRACHVL